MPKSKITRVEESSRPWNSPQGGTIYYRTIEFENGDVGSIGTTKEIVPDWMQEGKILEYTKDKTKIKRVNEKPSFGGGGFKKKDNTKTWESISSMFKLNALECAVETESYNSGVSRNDALVKYLEFLCDIPDSYKSGIDKWGKESEHLIVRMGVTKRVAQLFKVDKSMTLDTIVSKCNEYLSWVSKPL